MREIRDDLHQIRFTDGSPVFAHAAVHVVRRDPSVLHRRMKLLALLLRLEHDTAMRTGDLSGAMRALGSGETAFAASAGLSEGLLLMDAYLAPLFGALTPFVWAVPASRASGTFVLSLGTPLAGVSGEAAEPLQLLSSYGPIGGRPSPVLPLEAPAAALTCGPAALIDSSPP